MVKDVKGGTLFDELDMKVFENMEIMVPLIQVTFNKVGAMLDSYGNKIIKIVEEQKLRKWEINTKKKRTRYAPFLDSSDSFDKKTSTMSQIESLKQIFEVYNMVCLKEKAEKKRKPREITIFSGCLFDIDEKEITKQIYFQISQFDITNVEEALYRREEYEKMLSNIGPDYDQVLSHPTDDDEDMQEDISIAMEELDEGKIEDMFHKFETHILRPFLKDLDEK